MSKKTPGEIAYGIAAAYARDAAPTWPGWAPYEHAGKATKDGFELMANAVLEEAATAAVTTYTRHNATAGLEIAAVIRALKTPDKPSDHLERRT
jgi:hypothetical protein